MDPNSTTANVPIKLNDASIINNNSQPPNPQNVTSPPNYKLTIILIAIIVFAVILAFIFILLFAILKVHKKDKTITRVGNTNNRIPIILDVDEGGDDMIAYIVANNSKKFDILGITTVSGNYYVEDVGKIWLRFLEYMNYDNKVYLGENHPLVRHTEPLTFSHNYGFELPTTTKTLETKGGVDFLYETIKNSDKKITLFGLGPLTNIAKLIQRDSSIINNIEEIIIMGGAKEEGNVEQNPKAEWNIYMDAEAAEIVFNCGLTIKTFGQETKMDFDDAFYQKLLDMNTRSSLFTYYAAKGTFITWNDNWVYDPITVLYHLDNSIVDLNGYYVEVNTTNPDVNGTEYGSMYFYETNGNPKVNAKYSDKLHLDKCYEVFESYLKLY